MWESAIQNNAATAAMVLQQHYHKMVEVLASTCNSPLDWYPLVIHLRNKRDSKFISTSFRVNWFFEEGTAWGTGAKTQMRPFVNDRGRKVRIFLYNCILWQVSILRSWPIAGVMLEFRTMSHTHTKTAWQLHFVLISFDTVSKFRRGGGAIDIRDPSSRSPPKILTFEMKYYSNKKLHFISFKIECSVSWGIFLVCLFVCLFEWSSHQENLEKQPISLVQTLVNVLTTVFWILFMYTWIHCTCLYCPPQADYKQK